MKKILLLLAIIAAFSWQGFAQVSSYGFTASTGTFDTLVGGTNVSSVEVDFGISASLPIGFTFNFDGANFTDVKVGSDGFISFNSSATGQTSNNLDGISASNRPLVAPLWDDLAGGSTGSPSYASYLTTGTAPNRVFTFEWKNWEWNYASSDPVMTFQVKLYETSNNVEFLYKQETGAVNSGSASIGMTGVSSFLSLDGSGASPLASSTTETSNINTKPATGQIYTFTPPSCPAPSALTATTVTTSTANLGWTEAGSATLWQYEYDTAGFTQGSGNRDTTSLNPYTVSSLSSATNYEFYVRAVCGAGDTSNWEGPFAFTTLCNATVAPMIETFDGNSTPTCWSQTADNGGPWVFTGSPDYGASSATDHTGNGGSFAWMDQSSSDAAVSLISNDIDVSALTTAYLKFYYYTNNTNNGDINDLIVEAWDGSTWSQVDSLHVNNGGWTPYWYNLSTFTYGTNLVKIRFRAESGGGNDDYYQDQLLDDIAVIEMPSCFEPTALTLNSLTHSSATLGWTENGSATLWQYEYDTAGFTQGTGSMDTTSMNPATITGLTQLTDYDVYVRAVCGSGDSSMWTGPISFTTPPSCPAPDTLTVSNVMGTSASISWSEMGSATLWQYEYDTVGFTQGTGNIDTTSMNPVGLTGLTAETDYEYYVRAVCGIGDSSVWVGPYSFTTLCAAVAAPWSEDFSSSSIPNCWNQGINNSKSWLFTSSGGHVGNGGTIGGSTISGGNFAYVDDSSPHSTNTALESPLVDISGLTDPELSFYMISNNEGNTNVDFSIDIWDGSAWNVGFYSRDTNTVNGEWEQINLSLSSITVSGPVRVRFVVDENNGTDFYDDVAIDDVQLRETPTCVDVTSLVVSGITNNSAMLGWTENGTATLWQYEYDTAGFTPSTGTIDTTSNNPYTAMGLAANTSYDFYVRSVCGPGDTAGWVGPMTFTTLCNPVISFPYLEGFEDTSSTRGCWSNIQEVGSADWTYGAGASGGSISSAYEGSENARFVSSSGTNSPTTKLVSPILDLSGLTAPVVSFYYGQEDWSGDQNYTRVLYRTSGSASWVEIWSDSTSVSSWTQATVVLPNASATYQVAFEGINNYGRRNVVDNVFIGDTLSALAVVDSNVTCFGMSNGGATITANGGLMPYTYLWSNADTTASITGVAGGIYDVTVSDASGDSIMASVTITEPVQVVVSLGNDTSICMNELLTLDAGAGFTSYLWDNGDATQTRIVNSTSPASNAYSVIVTDASGCNGYDTINVDINAPMMPNLGNDTTICYDASITLDAGTGFNSYLWDDASTLQTKDVVGATVGSAVHTMYVTTTDANMCVGSDTIILTVDAEITLDLGNDTTVCSGTSFDLDAGAGYASYLWDDLTTMQTRTVATNAAGAVDYSVIVTTTAGCIGSSTVEVTGRAPVIVDLGPDTTIGYWGADTVYTLDAGTGFASYLWSDNVTTTQTFEVNKNNMGLIGVVVTDANGCIGTDTVRVDFLLSVPSFDVSTLKMYPNPASDLVNIEMSNFNNVDEVNVKFISITGEVVLRKQINVNGGSYQETFDVSNLATGTYFVQFEAKGEVVTRQFIIK